MFVVTFKFVPNFIWCVLGNQWFQEKNADFFPKKILKVEGRMTSPDLCIDFNGFLYVSNRYVSCYSRYDCGRVLGYGIYGKYIGVIYFPDIY